MSTLRADLKSWLEGQPPRRVVGIRNDPNRCVLSNFLSKDVLKPVTIRQGMAGARRLPLWACTYYTGMDTSCGRITGGYTASTALAELERA